MRVDVSKSKYREDPEAGDEYSFSEIRKFRVLLRRLRFLEANIRKHGGLQSESGGASFAEMEAEALEFVLEEAGFLIIEDRRAKART